MREWDVVLVIVVLLDMVLSIYNPLSKSQKENTQAMTELTVTMRSISDKLVGFEQDMDALEMKNHDSHRRIHEKIDDQEARIENHETRLQIIEKERN